MESNGKDEAERRKLKAGNRASAGDSERLKTGKERGGSFAA